MFLETLDLLKQDETGYTSIRFLADRLKELGYPMYKKKFKAYMSS